MLVNKRGVRNENESSPLTSNLQTHFQLLIASLLAGCFLLFNTAGCGPTYPKERFKESIVRVCKDEYSLDVRVETIGATIAIYVPLTDLIDFTFTITKTASDKINDVILSVSRVALSSDAEFNFYCIIAHDIRIPEIQIVIIKSVDDVKRFLLNDISRGEYSKRMLVDIRLNPQAKKEHAIKEVFERMTLDARWQEQVMNDFFRAEPAGLGDIGYWNGRFYVKDISAAEFLAEQIANRVKIEFKEDAILSEQYTVRSASGAYIARGEDRLFRIDLFIEQGKDNERSDGAREAPQVIFEKVLKVTADVLHGYKFNDFGRVEVANQARGDSIRVPREDLERFRTGKVTIEELIK